MKCVLKLQTSPSNSDRYGLADAAFPLANLNATLAHETT